MANKFGVGQPVTRVEDPKFLTGRGSYTDDISFPFQTYGVVLRSPHAHARIKSYGTAAAKAAPGVLLVLTGEDTAAEKLGGLSTMAMPEDMGGPKAHRTVQPILAEGVVRYVGNPVAFVVAETLAQAKDAAELIEIDYEPLPAVTSTAQAKAAGAPVVWPEAPGNVIYTLQMGDKAAVEAAFANAAHVETLSVINNRVSANAMEPRASVGLYDAANRRYTLYMSSQGPHRNKQMIAGQILRIPESDLRVISRDVGGGFGMKGQGYPEDPLVVWAAGKLGRPVKWTADRSESLQSDTHGRDQMDTIELAIDKDGKFTALRALIEVNLGSFISGAGNVPPLQTLWMLSGVYSIPAIFGVSRTYFSHTNPVGTYRGAGRPEASYMIERVIDNAARALKADPAELRRKNLIPPKAMPYKTAHGPIRYDSGEFETVLDMALKKADRAGFAARKAESEKRSRRRGFGIAYYIEISNVFNERMGLRLEADGSAVIFAGTFNHGQGHETAYAQLVSDWLGVPFEKVRLIQGDTDAVAAGRGTFGARSASVGGAALKTAANKIVENGKKFAAHMLEAAEADIEFADGFFKVTGTDRKIPLLAVARASHAPAGPLAKLGMIGLESVGAEDAVSNFPNGCHICEVEVDPATGKVEIVRYLAVDDVGTVINPLLVDGQVHGGVAQGIGQAMLENVAYDPDSGQLLSGSFMDYAMPHADDMCAIEVDLHVVPTPTNPLGVKGAGEAGSVAAPPALLNAIVDALAPLGVTHIEMPATPETVWRAIQAAGGRAAAE
jgi:carbon-monoxide dehydrogenase large subunit